MINNIKLHFISPQALDTPTITAHYDALLVIASVFTAVFASYISFLLSARINNSQLKKEGFFWTCLSACFLGTGIWAMHFIGMLAYKLPIPVNYDKTITMLSILPSIFASYIVISPGIESARRLIFKSILMGVGIGCMHFFGMMAMIMPAHMAYQPGLFWLSILVAIILSGIALKINALRQTSTINVTKINLFAALVMGSAIAGMHYIGMISMVVFETPYTTYITSNNHTQLAQLIIFVLFILSLCLLAAMELRARSLLSAKLKAVLNTVQDVVICFDQHGVIEFANPATINVFGFEQSELIGKSITLLLPEKNTSEQELFIKAELTGKSQLLQGCKKSGELFSVTLCVTPISERPGSPLVATIKDLTNVQNQEAFTQTVFDTLPIMLFVKDAESLTFTHVNKAGEQLLNKSREELLGLNDFDLFPEHEAKRLSEVEHNVLACNDNHITFEEPVTVNNVTRHLRTRKMAIRDNHGNAQFLLDVSEDITELHNAKVELESLHHRMSMAANAARIGVWEWNFKTNELIWDDWMYELYDLDKEAFSGSYEDWANTLHPDDAKTVFANLKKALLNNEEFHAEFRIILADGQIRYLNADGHIYGDKIIGINFDISERAIAEQKILQLAQTDNLTGLANRNALAKFVEHEFALTERTGKKVACLYFDLDKFKPINDTYGHLAGDHVLVEVAKRLTHITRKVDCIARIGGDEFVLIITQLDTIEQANIAQQRFITAIEKPIIFEQQTLYVGASIGYAIYPDEATDFGTLLSKADEKMYAYKREKTPQPKHTNG